jgi:hypothetical protein
VWTFPSLCFQHILLFPYHFPFLWPRAPLGDQPDQPNQGRGNSLGQSRGERAKGRCADDLGGSLIWFLNNAVKSPMGCVTNFYLFNEMKHKALFAFSQKPSTSVGDAMGTPHIRWTFRLCRYGGSRPNVDGWVTASCFS